MSVQEQLDQLKSAVAVLEVFHTNTLAELVEQDTTDNHLDEVKAERSELTSMYDYLGVQVHGLNSQISLLELDLENSKGDITDNANAISLLQSKLNTVIDDISTNFGDISDIWGRVENLELEVETEKGKGYINYDALLAAFNGDDFVGAVNAIGLQAQWESYANSASNAAIAHTDTVVAGMNGSMSQQNTELRGEFQDADGVLQAQITEGAEIYAGHFIEWDGVSAPAVGNIKFSGDIMYQYMGGTLGENNDGWVRTDKSANDTAVTAKNTANQTKGWVANKYILIVDPSTGAVTGIEMSDASNQTSNIKLTADNILLYGTTTIGDVGIPRHYSGSYTLASPPNTTQLGSSFKDSNTGIIYTLASDGWTSTKGNTGATGAKGDKGDKGDKGYTGNTGATGSRGAATTSYSSNVASPTGDQLGSWFRSVTGFNDYKKGDTIIYTYNDATNGYTKNYRRTSVSYSAWTPYSLLVNGNMIVLGSITSEQIFAGTRGYVNSSWFVMDINTSEKGIAVRTPSTGMYINSTLTNASYVGGISITTSGSIGLSSYVTGNGDAIRGDSSTGVGVRGDGRTGGGSFGCDGTDGTAVYARATGASGYGVVATGNNYGLFTPNSCYFEGSAYPFTGAHFILLKETPAIGDIIECSDAYVIEVSRSIALGNITTQINSKNVFGVFNGKHENIQDMMLASSTFSYMPDTGDVREIRPEFLPYYNQFVNDGYELYGANAIGEGAINVCEENGNITIGDYIISSGTKGKGMKQNDDVMHSYTVAKAIASVDWNDDLDEKIYSVNNEDGTQIKCRMIACTYHCG